MRGSRSFVRRTAELLGGVDAAAARATGRYFAAVDSDDMLMPGFCERTGAMLDAHPEIDVVGIDAFTFEEHDHSLVRGLRQMLGMRPADPEHRLTLEDIISGNGLYYTAAIRAEAWNRVGGYACDTPLAPANALFIRLVAAGCDVRVLDEKLARYRIRTDSTSTAPETKEAFEADVERSLREGAALADSPGCAARSTVGCASSASTRRCAVPAGRCWPEMRT